MTATTDDPFRRAPAPWRLPRPTLIAAAILIAAADAARADNRPDPTTLTLEQLLDVTIVGASKYEQKQSEVAAAASIITGAEIRTFGWRTLGEALASLPGLYTTYDRQYAYLGTRGFGLPGDFNTRVLVTINGNRINDPTFDQGQFDHAFPVDVDLIERIEFIPGPGGSVYGQNAMFGVVNVITRTGADIRGTELVAQHQNPQGLNQDRATWGQVLPQGFDVVLSVTDMHSRGENLFFGYGASGVSGVARGLDGERDRQLFASIAGGPWSFDYEHSERHKNDPTGAFLSDPLVPGQFQADGYDLTQLAYHDRFLVDSLQLSARVFMGEERYRSVLSYDTLFSFPATSDWHGVELRLVSTALAAHKLMVGLEAQDNVRFNQSILDFAHPAHDIEIPGSGYRIGVYAQDEWRIAAPLSATLGLRLDRNNFTGTQASPRVALIWQATPETTMKALYGTAHRAPNANERDYYDGLAEVANPALRGETIDTLEWVVDHRVNRALTLRSSIYQWTLHDVIALGVDPVTGLSQYQSSRPVEARGVELSADATWTSGARLRGSVSYQDVSYSNGAAPLNSPQVLAKVNFSTPLPIAGARLGYELHYDSKRLSIAGTDIGGYTLSNLVLSSDALGRGIGVSLGLYNLFDKRYAQPAADSNWQNSIDQDGRSIRLSASIRF